MLCLCNKQNMIRPRSRFRPIGRLLATEFIEHRGVCVSTRTFVVISISTKTIRLFSILALGTSVLAGCSETSFKDAFDMGKVAPDESQVQANRSLTMPPDLQLRAPDGTVANPQVAANQPPVYNQQPVNTQPPQYGAVYQPGTPGCQGR